MTNGVFHFTFPMKDRGQIEICLWITGGTFKDRAINDSRLVNMTALAVVDAQKREAATKDWVNDTR